MLCLADLRIEQVQAVDFIGSGEDTLLLADVGTGKTVIALTAIQDSIENATSSRWLVVAPKRVARDVWKQEADKWAHINLTVECACGTPKHRQKVIAGGAQIVTLNYENLIWLLDSYIKLNRTDPLPFDAILFDEIDKMKDCKSKRFKAMKMRIGSLSKRIGMTGTITPNHLLEIWGPTYLVDAGVSLGRSFYKFRSKYFYPTDYNQYNWAALPNSQKLIEEKIADISFRLEGKGLPAVVTLPPRWVYLDQKTRQFYLKLEKDLIAAMDDETIDAANEAVLTGKLQQITAGFSYIDGEPMVTHHRLKLDELDDLISELNGQQLMIVYHFKEELAMLRRHFTSIGFLSGVTDKTAAKTIDAWNSGELELLALHPQSAGHGLNLQHSGAHHIATTTMPWSGGMYKQVVGRLARTGQTAPTVFVHPIMVHDTIDATVLGVINERQDRLQALLESMKGRQQ